MESILASIAPNAKITVKDEDSLWEDVRKLALSKCGTAQPKDMSMSHELRTFCSSDGYDTGSTRSTSPSGSSSSSKDNGPGVSPMSHGSVMQKTLKRNFPVTSLDNLNSNADRSVPCGTPSYTPASTSNIMRIVSSNPLSGSHANLGEAYIGDASQRSHEAYVGDASQRSPHVGDASQRSPAQNAQNLTIHGLTSPYNARHNVVHDRSIFRTSPANAPRASMITPSGDASSRSPAGTIMATRPLITSPSSAQACDASQRLPTRKLVATPTESNSNDAGITSWLSGVHGHLPSNGELEVLLRSAAPESYDD